MALDGTSGVKSVCFTIVCGGHTSPQKEFDIFIHLPDGVINIGGVADSMFFLLLSTSLFTSLKPLCDVKDCWENLMSCRCPNTLRAI